MASTRGKDEELFPTTQLNPSIVALALPGPVGLHITQHSAAQHSTSTVLHSVPRANPIVDCILHQGCVPHFFPALLLITIPHPQHHHRPSPPPPPTTAQCQQSSMLLPMWPIVLCVSGVLRTSGDLPEVPDLAAGWLAGWLAAWLPSWLPSWLPAPSSRHGETLGTSTSSILTHLISSTRGRSSTEPRQEPELAGTRQE